MSNAYNTTDIFVKLYLQYECLWNPVHRDYRTNFRRQEAYNTMITEYHNETGILLTEREVRNKINSIRVCYSKIVKRGVNCHGKYNTKLKWFPGMHECLKQFQKKKLSNDVKDSSGDDDDENRSVDEIQNVWVTPDESDDEIKSDPQTPQHDDYILLLKSETDEIEPTTERKRPLKNRKRKQNYSISPEQNVNVQDRSVNEDEFDAFGKFIATQLRGLGLKKALSVQLELHDIVRKARLDNLPENED